jgi:hypothetical protein
MTKRTSKRASGRGWSVVGVFWDDHLAGYRTPGVIKTFKDEAKAKAFAKSVRQSGEYHLVRVVPAGTEIPHRPMAPLRNPEVTIARPANVLAATRGAWAKVLGGRGTNRDLVNAIRLDEKGDWVPGHVLISTETGFIPDAFDDKPWRAAEKLLQRSLDDKGVYFEHLNSAISYVVVPGWEDQGYYTVAGKFVPPRAKRQR